MNSVHPSILACMWFAPPRRVQELQDLLEPTEDQRIKNDLAANTNKVQQRDDHALAMQIRQQVQ